MRKIQIIQKASLDEAASRDKRAGKELRLNDKIRLEKINKKFQTQGIIILDLTKIFEKNEPKLTKSRCIMEYLNVINKNIKKDQSGSIIKKYNQSQY